MNFDEYQQEVIQTNDNILVIAGPGSGKTTTILQKVDFLLAKNEKINILLLSFTNKSVNDIKNRISNENVDIMTFHKLAIDILKSYNVNYQIVNNGLLPYIIDEYFLKMNRQNLNKLCRYLNILHFSINSKEYLSLKKLIITFISLFKTNNHNISKLHEMIDNYQDKYLIDIILSILNIYELEKQSANLLDFDDLIVASTNLLKSNYLYKKDDYIIINEFQDTSLIRLNLIKEIYNYSQAKITAVGDDAQAIFHFSGCDLNIFLNFTSYFPNAKKLFLKNTYRNSQEIINISEKFIEKNPNQLVKKMHSNIHTNKPIQIIFYFNAIKALKRLLDSLKDEEIMILSRNYNDIYNYIDSTFSFSGDNLIYNNKQMKYLTIHSSKGLESKYIIILNNEDSPYGFPNKLENHPILKYVTPNKKEIPYAEERRLFFVAITRCKLKTFLLVPYKKPSIFIKELNKILKKKN